MHIHGNQLYLSGINPYSAAAEKAAAAQKAAYARSRLRKGWSENKGVRSSEGAPMGGDWGNSAPRLVDSDVDYRRADAGKDSDFG